MAMESCNLGTRKMQREDGGVCQPGLHSKTMIRKTKRDIFGDSLVRS